MTRRLLLLLLLGGCAAARPSGGASDAPAVLSFPSELPSESALQLARNVLIRAGWPSKDMATGATFATDWHAGRGDSLRLVVTSADVEGGASSVVSVRGEALVGGRAVGVARGAAAWPEVERIARQVGAGVRYALY